MPRTRRAQILMDPAEYRELEKVAQRERVSVAELVRIAVRGRYLSASDKRVDLVEEIIGMNLPMTSWDETEKDIVEAHRDDVP